jgi:hypothetical protein
MPPKKKQSEEAKKLEQYRKDVIKAMIKLKKENGRNLLYDKGDNWNTKISEMKSVEQEDFKYDLFAQLEVDSSPEEAAEALSSKALKLKIIEPHVTDSERLKEVKEEKEVKTEVKEPVPVSDPPNKQRDSKDSSFSDNQKKTEEPVPVSDPTKNQRKNLLQKNRKSYVRNKKIELIKKKKQ